MEGPQEEKETELFDNGDVCKFSVKCCNVCKKVKPLKAFYAPKREHGRYRLKTCRSCKSRMAMDYRKKNPDRWKVLYKNARLRQKHGIKAIDVEAMLDDQKWLCAICGIKMETSLRNKPNTACVDHNHSTGKIRKILCLRCNAGIGYFDENIEFMKSAITYLEDHRQWQIEE